MNQKMKKSPWMALLALLMFASLTLTACGGSDEPTAEPATDEAGASGDAAALTVTGTEFAFDPVTLNIAPDSPTVIELTNAGNIEHDFAIEGYEADKVAASPGQSATGTFTLPAGTYKFYCSIPGHEAAGMVGTIEVG